MKWHVACRIGEADSFRPDTENGDVTLTLHFSGGAANARVRESVVATIEKQYKATMSGCAVDFLYASMAAYLADLCVPRKTATDRWCREMVLHIPVFCESRWRRGRKSLASALRYLTGDEWTISTRARECDSPCASAASIDHPPTKACFLSGGLDSLVGAIDLLSGGDRVAFVSHHGGGLTPKFQNAILAGLRRKYEEQFTENQFFVVPPQLDGEGENSMRSRSILFFGLGMSVTSVLGPGVPLVVPENGLISLNVPMTASRIGSSSTRTTHPFFVMELRKGLRDLGLRNEIVLPYRHKTKGEMLMQAADQQVLSELLGDSMSCSHPEVARWEGATPGTHCGYCFPCIIRRASVAKAALQSADADYTHDVRSNAPSGKRGQDLRAVKTALLRNGKSSTPAFLRVQEAGPLPSGELSEFADVYERGMKEIHAFLRGA